jgi:streptogramin lyase
MRISLHRHAAAAPSMAHAARLVVVLLIAGSLALWGPAPPAAATTPAGVITNFGLAFTPSKVVAGPDGNLWFANGGGGVGKMTTSGTVTIYRDPGITSVYDLAVGPDGNVWFGGGTKIGRVTPSGSFTFFTTSGLAASSALVAGADGNLWFGNNSSSLSYGKITPAGAITLFTDATLQVQDLVAGPDGNVWFTDDLHAAAGSIAADATVTRYTDASIDRPLHITLGADGNLWFSNHWTIDRLTTAGVFTSFPDAIQYPDLISGPDGNLWLASHGWAYQTMTTAGVAGPEISRPPEVFQTFASGADGNVWAAGTDAAGHPGLARITVAGVVTWFDGNSVRNPIGLTLGADGNVWFTNTDSIGRMTPAGVVTLFPDVSINAPQSIVAGPDGNVWFTNRGDASSGPVKSSIGRITPGGVVTSFTDPGIVRPAGIAAGSDGNLWFTNTANAGGWIGRITPTGTVTTFADPGVTSPFAITSGPDGNVWFTTAASSAGGTTSIGRITPAGAITLFTHPSLTNPGSIATGPDGNLWFTNTCTFGGSDTCWVGRMTTSGTITSFVTGGAYVMNVTEGPDGNLWYSRLAGGSWGFGRITTTGNIWNFPGDATVNFPRDLAVGPNGNIWFTNDGSGGIGTISTGSTAVATIQGTVRSGGTALGGMKVVLYADYPSWTIVATTLTNAIGHYRFPINAAGTYRVQFIDNSGNHQRSWFASSPTYAASTAITVMGGATATADQSLAPSTSRLLGRATNSSGTGLAGISVSVYYGSSSGFIEGATTGPAGYYTIKDLPPGTYYVRFSDPTNTYKAQWYDGKAVFANARAITLASGDVIANASLVAN